MPDRGIGYGLLRYLGGSEAAAELAAGRGGGGGLQLPGAVRPGGLRATASSASRPSRRARRRTGAARAPTGWRCAASVQGGPPGAADRLLRRGAPAGDGGAPGGVVRRGAAGDDRALHVGAEAGGYTPSDFPLAGLDQAALDALLGSGRGVEDVYPLTPLQEGMLFHALYAPGSGVYVGQFGFVLEGPLDADALERGVAERGGAARGAAGGLRLGGAAAPGAGHPPRGEAALPAGGLAGAGRGRAAGAPGGASSQADRAEGFDLGRAPLMRLALFRTADEEHQLVWTHHHLVVDGWSLSLLFRDVLAGYAAYARGETPQLGAGAPLPGLHRLAGAAGPRARRAVLAGGAGRLRRADSAARGAGGPRRGGERGPGRGEAVAAGGAHARAAGAGAGVGRDHEHAGAGRVGAAAGRATPARRTWSSGRRSRGGRRSWRGWRRRWGCSSTRSRCGCACPPGPRLRRVARGAAEGAGGGARVRVQRRWWRCRGGASVPAGEPLFESLVVFENYPVDQAVGRGGRRAGRAAGAPERGTRAGQLPAGPVGAGGRAAQGGDPLRRGPGGSGGGGAAGRAPGGWCWRRSRREPGRRLSELSLLRAAERAQLLEAWNATGAGYAGGRASTSWFARQARAHARRAGGRASRGARRSPTPSWSAAPTGWRTTSARLGVGPEARVGICVERCAGDGRRACWACSRPAAPTCRWTRRTPPSAWPTCWRMPALAVLLTQEGLLERLPRHGARAVCLDRDAGGDRAAGGDGARERPATRRTWRTSSTPRAPPGGPRAWWWSTGAWATTWRGRPKRTPARGAGPPCTPPSPSTCGDLAPGAAGPAARRSC